MVKNEEARSWEYAEVQLSYEARYCGHWWPVQQQLDLFNYWLKEQHPELKPRTIRQFKGKIKKDKWKQKCNEFYEKRLVSKEDSLSYACRKLDSWFKTHDGAKEQYIKEHKEFHEKAKKKAETKQPVKMLEGLSTDQILSSKRESCMKTSTNSIKLIDLTPRSDETKKTSSKKKASINKPAAVTIVPEEYLMAHLVTVAWPDLDVVAQKGIFETQMSTMAGTRYSSTVEQFQEAVAEYTRQEELKIDLAIKRV